MRPVIRSLVVATLALTVAQAYGQRAGDAVTVAETLRGDQYLAGNVVRVQAAVQGDVAAAGRTLIFADAAIAFWERMLDEARQKIVALDIVDRCTVVKADVLDHPFPAQAFDTALVGFLIFYVSCLAITWFVYTRPGGVLFDVENKRALGANALKVPAQ